MMMMMVMMMTLLVEFLQVYLLKGVTTIELVVTTVESVRESKSERTSLLNDTIVRGVKL